MKPREKTIMKRRIIISVVFLFMALVFAAFKPIKLSTTQKRVEGKIIAVSQGGVKDVVFKIENDIKQYRIKYYSIKIIFKDL